MSEAPAAPKLAHEHMITLDVMAGELRDIVAILYALSAHNGETEFPARGLVVVSDAVERIAKELDVLTGGGE